LDISFIAMEDISEDGEITKMHTKKLGDVRKGYTYFAEGDVLFAKITPCMENNKGAIARNLVNRTGMGSTEFFVLRTKNKADLNFVYHLTMSKIYRSLAERWMQGSAGQRRVPKDFFSKRPIVLPTAKARIELGAVFRAIDDNIRRSMQYCETLHQTRMMLLNDFLNVNGEAPRV
jgi:type I restriction enzyme S subunit